MALSSPSAAHHFFWAKGRSTETVKTTVSSMSDKVWLKWRVWVEQIPVSIDGMILRTFFLPAKSANDFFSRAGVINEKSWAISPTWSWDPVKVTGFPKNVVIEKTPFLFLLYPNGDEGATDLFRKSEGPTDSILLRSCLSSTSSCYSSYRPFLLFWQWNPWRSLHGLGYGYP